MYIMETYFILHFFQLATANCKYIFKATNIMTLHLTFILLFITCLRKENDKKLEI